VSWGRMPPSFPQPNRDWIAISSVSLHICALKSTRCVRCFGLTYGFDFRGAAQCSAF
jgi:hypothetical protein